MMMTTQFFNSNNINNQGPGIFSNAITGGHSNSSSISKTIA